MKPTIIWGIFIMLLIIIILNSKNMLNQNVSCAGIALLGYCIKEKNK